MRVFQKSILLLVFTIPVFGVCVCKLNADPKVQQSKPSTLGIGDIFENDENEVWFSGVKTRKNKYGFIGAAIRYDGSFPPKMWLYDDLEPGSTGTEEYYKKADYQNIAFNDIGFKIINGSVRHRKERMILEGVFADKDGVEHDIVVHIHAFKKKIKGEQLEKRVVFGYSIPGYASLNKSNNLHDDCTDPPTDDILEETEVPDVTEPEPEYVP